MGHLRGQSANLARAAFRAEAASRDVLPPAAPRAGRSARLIKARGPTVVSWLSYSSLIPPNLFILLAMIGVLVAWRRKPFGLALATGAIGCLYLVAMPVAAGLLIRSAEMLRQAGIGSALVVAHPWDMARALWSFRAVGYPVIPSPAPDGASPSLSAAAFLPQVPALLNSYYALHELIGLAWYRVRYGHR